MKRLLVSLFSLLLIVLIPQNINAEENIYAYDWANVLDEEVEKRVLVETSFEELSTLPLVQRRRIIKYYLQKKTYEEIAKEENCSKVAVKYSIDLGIEKISKKMKF